jgi:hypothetical protein
MARQLESSTPSRVKGASAMTPGRAIRQFCMECVGAENSRAAFDCLSQVCPLYAACPFWHKPMPVTMRDPDYDGEPDIPRPQRRRPSRSLISAYCRTCPPGDRTDCQSSECPLYPYRPWPGPGRVPRRVASASQRAAATKGTGASLRARGHARSSESSRQEASTAVGAAFDA